ncbi:hypothetical protein CsSME_00040903 [Camellia sinensis var. sinensis]
MPRIRIWDKQEVFIEKVVQKRQKCITTVIILFFFVLI